MAGRIRIGEILLHAGVIDQHQLNAALGEQRRWGRPLGVTLVKMGLVDERDLVRALASQLSLPVASLEGKRIANDVLALVPAEMARQRMILPLFVKQSDRRTTLYLAMEDPGDLAALDDLAFRTGFQVKPVMMGPSELCEGIDRYYRDVPADSAAGPGDAAPRAGSPASDVAPRAGSSALGDPTPRAGSPAASDAAAGTAELERHFRGGDASPAPKSTRVPEPASPPAASPGSASLSASLSKPVATPVPPPVMASPAPPLAATNDVASTTKFDETSLASPPPREQREGQASAPVHPPVESLASYDARTRTILHVLTQLLIEKGVISREEIHDRVSALAAHDQALRERASIERD